MNLYLCRHGETEWSLSGQHTGKTDLPLTERGRRQAEQLRSRLQGISFEKVFVSPRKRALETCQGIEAEIEPLAAEWDYGDYEGLTSQEIHKKDPRWNVFVKGAPHGETPQQIGHRADLLIEKLSQYQGNVALFSHGHFLKVLTVRFLKLDVEYGRFFSLSVASLSILGYEEGQPLIKLWNSN